MGDEVLVLLPIPGNPLHAKYSGPYTVHQQLNDFDYIIDTPGHCKNQHLCHVNMLKLFNRRHNDKTVMKSCAPVAKVYV